MRDFALNEQVFGRVSSDDNYRVHSRQTRFQIHEFQLSHKGVSEVSEQACEQSEVSIAKQSATKRVSSASERT